MARRPWETRPEFKWKYHNQQLTKCQRSILTASPPEAGTESTRSHRGKSLPLWVILRPRKGKIGTTFLLLPRGVTLKHLLRSVCLIACFLAAVSELASSTSGPPTFLDFSHDYGFCLRGIIPELQWNLTVAKQDRPIWGSFCDNDSSTGRIQSQEFLAPAEFSMFLAGYMGQPGLRFYLHNLQTGEDFDLAPKPPPGDSWRFYTFSPPASWVGQSVEIIGEDRVTTVYGWMGFTAPELPLASTAATDIVTSGRAQSGFCSGNNLPLVSWGTSGPPTGITTWRSYCSGDNDTGWMETEPFKAPAYLNLYVAGYPGTPGIRLRVENVSTGEQQPLQTDSAPGEAWIQYYFPLPPDWKGQPIRLLAEDKAERPEGWVALAVPPRAPWTKHASFGLRLLLLVIRVFVLTMLPAAAACVIGVRRSERSPLEVTTIALMTLLGVGYVTFWLYFLNRTAGEIFSWVTLVLSVGVVIWSCGKRRRAISSNLHALLIPSVLVLLASLFVTSLGFIYGRPASIQEYAAARFGPPDLSIDNFLPKLLADRAYEGHVPKLIAGDWLSSDRPPLQSGSALWFYTWTHDRNLVYQVLGTILQFTFLAALWAYLDAAGISRKAMALVFAAVLFSGFTIENTFFVWPKLLPVGPLLIIAAYLFTDKFAQARTSWRTGVALGALAAFAMLCHGGTFFGVVGIALTAVVLRRIPTARFIGAASLAAVLLYLPWMLYQKYGDPPGDRLLKWHLAGVIEPHPEEKLSHLLVSRYRALGWQGTINHKEANFVQLADHPPFWSHISRMWSALVFGTPLQRGTEAASLRHTIFLHWFWSIDLFTFVLIVWLVRLFWRRPDSVEFHQSSVLWVCSALTLLNWCLLMFGATMVHHGCYLTEICAFAAGALTLFAISPAIAAAVVACHAAFSLTIYAFLMPPRPVGVGTMFGPVNGVLACASVLSAAIFLFVLWRAAWPDTSSELNRVSRPASTLLSERGRVTVNNLPYS